MIAFFIAGVADLDIAAVPCDIVAGTIKEGGFICLLFKYLIELDCVTLCRSLSFLFTPRTAAAGFN
jgi:hypothetical protein